MRSTVSTLATGLVALWASWALVDIQQQARRQQPPAVAEVIAPAAPQQPIPDRAGLSYWPGP